MKMIGAKSYHDGLLNHVMQERYENMTAWDAVLRSNFLSPRDTKGHGTSSMNFVASSLSLGVYADSEQSMGTVQGLSPTARIVAYKVGYENLLRDSNCFDVDILSGFNSAIHYGVDVMLLSLGSDDLDIYLKDLTNAVAIRSFHAVMTGIPIVACRGNWDFSRKDYRYQDNTNPLVLTAGENFINKQYLAEVTFENNLTYVGGSLYDADVEPLPNGKSFPLNGPCVNGIFDPDLVKEKLVICLKGNVTNTLGAFKEAYSMEVVFLNVNDNYPFLFFDRLPYIKVSANDLSNDTVDYILKDLSHVASSTHIHMRLGRPYVGHFSISGPNKNNPEILKPDVLAPGVLFNIIESRLKKDAIS